MSEATVVESRLSKLEQDNRWLKLTVGALVSVLAAVPLIGAVMPEQIPQVITARQFRVTDVTGTTRASMDNSGIAYYDRDGTRRARIGDAISYWDENNIIRVLMGTPGIVYQDGNGNVVWRTPER